MKMQRVDLIPNGSMHILTLTCWIGPPPMQGSSDDHHPYLGSLRSKGPKLILRRIIGTLSSMNETMRVPYPKLCWVQVLHVVNCALNW